MRALVTGSAGFVGRHMVNALAARGYTVNGMDIMFGDDCRAWFGDPVNRSEHFDLVVHCAAVVGGRKMIDGRPLHLAVTDLQIDAALFEWAMMARPDRIVYFSSAAAYPVNCQREDTRDHFPRLVEMMTKVKDPDATYGWVKLTGERLAEEANALGIRTHVFRPFSGYGADQALDYPFPAIIARAKRQDAPFVIWGDGQSSRDWVHIDDVVAAVLCAIENDVLGPVNICTGIETTFDQLATLAMHAAGYDAPLAYDVAAPRGVHRRVGDPTRLHAFYTPKISIELGVAKALAEIAR